jgi:hypothetical protein
VGQGQNLRHVRLEDRLGEISKDRKTLHGNLGKDTTHMWHRIEEFNTGAISEDRSTGIREMSVGKFDLLYGSAFQLIGKLERYILPYNSTGEVHWSPVQYV